MLHSIIKPTRVDEVSIISPQFRLSPAGLCCCVAMGILQSVLSSETDEEEEVVISSPTQWNHPTVNHNPPLFFKENAPQTLFRESIGKCEEKRREKLPPAINCRVDGRWINHYCNSHRILLVGDGDFSFSTSLAAAFGWASNIVATSLDSQAFLVKNYQNALSNLVELSIRKCTVMHEIDATKMADHLFLAQIKFDRIIFNFPFAGFFKDAPRESQLRRHRRLVSKFLMNAKKMVSENGEIHITHKTNGFHGEWKIESIASSHKLVLMEAVEFDQLDYPGYNTKCGFGGDNNFNCNPSKTFKFRLSTSNTDGF